MVIRLIKFIRLANNTFSSHTVIHPPSIALLILVIILVVQLQNIILHVR